jgi:MFS family permease
MGLAVESVKDVFNFVFKYPKAFLATFILMLVSMVLGFIVAFSIVIGGWIGTVFLVIVIIACGFPVLIVAGVYPVMVYQALRYKKVSIRYAFHIVLRKLPQLFILVLIIGGVALLLAMLILVPSSIILWSLLSNAFSGPLLAAALILMAVCFVAMIYVLTRLFFAIPVLMIENKGVIDSIKASWSQTSGYVLSISGAIVLLSLIFIPLNISGIVFELIGGFIYVGWVVISNTIISTLSGVLPTIYYLNRKMERRPHM